MTPHKPPLVNGMPGMPPATQADRDEFYAKLNQSAARLIFSPLSALDEIRDRMK